MGVLEGGGAAPGGFHLSIFASTLHVGAMVEPLTSQMAEYFGVQSGLMVKQVARKSEAAASGLKAFDVILKVGADAIATSADWDRTLRSNEGKPVQVTILRDKKQQTITLQVDSKHRGALEAPEFFAPDIFGSGFLAPDAIMAETTPLLDEDFARALSAQAAADANAAAEAARSQADALNQELGQELGGVPRPLSKGELNQDEIEKLQRQAEKLRESAKNFQIDPEQMKQLEQQTEKLRENMKGFQIDPKQMEQLQQQMEEFRKDFSSDEMKQLDRQMEQFRQEMQQWQERSCANCV